MGDKLMREITLKYSHSQAVLPFNSGESGTALLACLFSQ
jgi:hypothetical protein